MLKNFNPSILVFFFFLLVGSSFGGRQLNDNKILEWVKRDHRRFLRAVIHVSDLDSSVKFYNKAFGMRVWKSRNFPDRQYRDALVGFGPQNTHFLLELRQRLDSNNVFIGTKFGQFGIVTQDVYNLVERARANGGNVTKEPEKIGGGNKNIFGIVEDHDGYKFKIIQSQQLLPADPLSQIMLRVEDVNRSVTFYEKALGMKLFQRQDHPQQKVALGYGTNQSKTVLELEKRNNNIPRDDGRDGYSMLYIGTDNVNKSAEAAKVVIKEIGGNLIIEPVFFSNINVSLTGFSDPDGWRTIMVDNKDYLSGGL